jgi:hypothetical protein
MITSSTNYQNGIYADVRQINSKIVFTFNGTTTTYYDDYITQLTIVEEMSTMNDSLPSDELQVTLDNTDGRFNFLNLSNMQQIIAQRPQIDVSFGLVINGVEEWIPMGSFFLDSWKNDVGAVTVTLIAHDVFTMLDNISYGNVGKGANMTLYSIAVDVFAVAGITNYSIDDSLKTITTTTGFKDYLTCRLALQNIGIAARCAVYQDRNGVVQIKPFVSLESGSNYANYVGGGLYAGFDPFDSNAYAKVNDGNGMRRMDLETMWTVPEIALDKSIYQLIVNVYSTTENFVTRSRTNSAIAGQNGQSFTIDNPLINTTDLADKVIDWFVNESNFNVVYKANWRGNPILENGDIVIISNGIDTTYSQQGRIYKQEFQYAGYLTCQTEARGGL